MAHLHITLLLTILLTTLLFSTSNSNATEMPQSATKKLEKILLSDEFQPRQENNGIWEKLIRHYGPQIKEFLRNFSQLQGFGKQLSQLGDWLVNLIKHARNLLLVGVAFMLIYAIISFLRKLSTRHFKDANTIKHVTDNPSPSNIVTTPLATLLATQKYNELLSALRLLLRRHLAEKYAIPISTTDRELQNYIPNSESEKTESEKTLFQDISSTFEGLAFAITPTEPRVIKALYERYQNHLPEALK